MKRKTRNISPLIRERVNSVDRNAEVILYGSRARGDERSDSDWDILIIADYPIDLEKEQAFRGQLYDLELELGEAISVFIYSKSDWKTKHHSLLSKCDIRRCTYMNSEERIEYTGEMVEPLLEPTNEMILVIEKEIYKSTHK